MKCTSKLLCIVCCAALLLSGCGQISLDKEYDAYSYHNSFTNQDVSVNADYFANNLCVTNTINFNTEGTYARVAQGAGVFDLTTNEVKEVILATDPTVEGETTALYIAKLLEGKDINVSRLAYGLPMGGHLTYADELTLLRSLEGRKQL